MEALAAEIFKYNPQLNKESLRILFSKSFYANAASMGEGTILFNIALFNRLQNESQAAFVLCHELAHYYLDHSNNNIQQYVATVYSDDFQKKLKKIQKSDFQQNKQVEALAENLMFKSRRHSRVHEQAADSMALELMKNTDYDVREALTCLALLDSTDKDKYAVDLQLEKQFQFAAYPFKKSWLQNDGLLLQLEKNDKTLMEDSLKTHPDCKKRIAALTDKVGQYQKKHAQKFIVSEKEFEQLKLQFDFETINYCYTSKNISRCLYYTLEMLHFFPENVFLNTMAGNCLNAIYTAQRNHELGKIVDLPNPSENNEYNTLLQFIQNLRLQEIASLSYHYLSSKEALFSSNQDFRTALSISKANLKP